jgi:hypothetical protein
MLAPSKVGAVTLAARLDATSQGPVPTPPVLGDWVPSETGALGGPSPWRRDGVQRPRDEDSDGLTGQRGGPAQAGVSNGNGTHGTGGLPAWAGGPPGSSVPVDLPAAVAPAGADRAKAATPPPGAYLPPSGAFSARDSGLPRGRLVLPGSARVSIASASVAAVPPAAASAPSVEADQKPRPGVALLADLPFGPPNSLPGWLIAAGSAAAIAGLLLPWSRSIPFATGFGYLDTWGLATPSHLLLLLLTMVTLSLAILPNRVPTWLRNGVVGLVMGGLLLGITWPYLLDGFGAMIGALAEAAAGLLLIIGGLLAVRQERHAEDEPAV